MTSIKKVPFWAVILFIGMLGYTTVLNNEHKIHLKEAQYKQMVEKINKN